MEKSKRIDDRAIHKNALSLMLWAVLFESFTPLFIGISNAKSSPFAYIFLTRIAEACFAAIFIAVLVVWKKNPFSYEILRSIIWGTKNIPMGRIVFLGTLTCLDVFLLVWSFKYIDATTATLFHATWPFTFVFAMSKFYPSEEDLKFTLTKGVFALMIFAFIGYVFIFMGDNGILFSTDSAPLDTAKGAILAILAGVVGYWFAMYAMRHCELSRQIITKIQSDPGPLYCAVIYLAITRPIAAAAAGVGVYVNDESIAFDLIWIFATFSGLTLAISTVLFRLANLTTKNLGINALAFGTPLFTLVWLLLVPYYTIDLIHPDLLIIGSAAIIAANALVNFEASILSAYKALIIALWISGTVIYFFPGIPLPDYFDFVAISATVFILILSFRLDRMVRRTAEEERTLLHLFRKCQKVAGNDNRKADKIKKLLLDIDRHNEPKEMRDAYISIRYIIQNTNCDDISDWEGDVDALVNSMQQGRNFGEQMALALMGTTLIFSLLFFQPLEMSGWQGFIVQVSSFILAAVIFYLYFNIMDLQNDRFRSTLEYTEDGGDCLVDFYDTSYRRLEKRISAFICILIVAAYGWLFLYKWIIS